MVIDVYSRKVVGWSLRERECAEYASEMIQEACKREHIQPHTLSLHADNGGPMKGATMLITLQRLGVIPSFSRPGVSDDNPYSESLFKTLKYVPEYPHKPFASMEEASAWVTRFVDWYNTRHLHSEIRYVTPESRHQGLDTAILKQRKQVYLTASKRHPERWSKTIRNWDPVNEVHLNPAKQWKDAA